MLHLKPSSNLRPVLLAGAGLLALAAGSLSATAQQVALADTESVIVTGTRVSGLTAEDSAAPITVLGSDTLSHVGEPDLIQSLAQNIPSFNAEAHGGDTGALTLSARLRGLSPNDTLVLVDGKRRHGSANLHVDAGQFQGAATTDLDLIPLASIDHIEVLQDGAAAQYGTDAIAGVINIILKHNDSGGLVQASGGQYFAGDGDTYDFSGNIGFDLGGKGFVSITGERRFRGFSQRGGDDPRLVQADGTPYPAGSSSVPPYPNLAVIPGFPRSNPIDGDPQSLLDTVLYNSEYSVAPGVTLYSFGSYGHRDGKNLENSRNPGTVIASQYSNQQYLPSGAVNPGYEVASTSVNNYNNPGEVIFSTTGFVPLETLNEEDWSYTFGAKGDLAGWSWDLSGTYGKDIDKIGSANSANLSLFTDLHSSPSQFYDGSFIASQATFNADFSRNIELGLATPLTAAFGFEGREDTYAITPGDPASYYKTGAQAFPGYAPFQALAKSRKNYAEYIDLSVSPIKDLQLDVAGRHENYTDFGDAQVGKITARYDITPEIAVRGTIASGFRAPTLQEEYYNATNVSPTSAIVQIGPNSPAAQIEGIQKLKPESSANFSAGLVAHLWDGLSATIDGYSIAIGNRIVGTGNVYYERSGVVQPGGAIIAAAIAANGNVLDPTVNTQGTTVFANAVSTLTQGVDITTNYATDFGDYGNVNWTAGANWGETSVSRIAPNPAPLQAAGATLVSPIAISTLTQASPKFKISLGALWSWETWSVNLRETIYGPSSQLIQPSASNAPYISARVETAAITDLEISKTLFDNLTLTVGANNLFNKSPEAIGLYNGATADGSSVYYQPNAISPYGIDGGFYYGRVTFNF
jgi:iron complex outermembrane recepter protein